MYFIVQIVLCILFYFNFGNSFRDSKIVYDIYWTTLEFIDDYPTVGRFSEDHNFIVNMPKLQWAAICKHTFKDVIKGDEAYIDKHVNFLMIVMYNEERCSKIQVWVPKLKQHVEQYACVCFISPSVITLDIPHEYIQYYQERVMIYPKNLNEIMVFFPNMEEGGYNILEIFSHKRWCKYSQVREEKVKIAVPQSYSEISNLQTILNPIFSELENYSLKSSNVLRQSKMALFSKICRIVYRRVRYIEEIIVSLTVDIPKHIERVVVILRMGNDEPKLTYMSAYICRGHIPNTSTVTTKYKIAAGPNDISLIVLRETDCPNNTNFFPSESVPNNQKCYEIIELIEYLTPNYINFSY